MRRTQKNTGETSPDHAVGWWRNRAELTLPMLGLLALFCTHMYFVNRYGVNIAFSDDYNEILRNLVSALDAGSFTGSVKQMFYGFGISKPIMARMVARLHYLLLGEINFRYLVLTGSLFLLPLCLVLGAATWKVNRYLMVAAGCMVLQPQHWEAIFQATLSNSVFSCLFFSMAAIYCAAREEGPWHIAALGFAVLAQMSFGNGFLVYPILMMMTVLTRKFRLCAVVLAQTVLTTWLYTFGTTVSLAEGTKVGLIEKLKMIFFWLPEFYGSSLGYLCGSGYSRQPPGETVSFVLGLMIIVFYSFLLARKYWRQNLLLFSLLTFFMLTGVLAAWQRFDIEVPGASRYQIQSALCVLLVLSIAVDLYAGKLNRHLVTVLIVGFPLAFTLTSYKTNYPAVLFHKNRLISDLVSWQKTGVGLTIWSEREAAGALLIECMNRNIYRLPSREAMMADYWKK